MTIKIEDASEPKEFIVSKQSEFARVGQKGKFLQGKFLFDVTVLSFIFRRYKLQGLTSFLN